MNEVKQLAFVVTADQLALPEPKQRSGFEDSPCHGCRVNCCHGVALWLPEEVQQALFREPDTILQRRDGQVQVAYKTCEQLQDDGSCGIYGDERRPEQCEQFPYGPDDSDPDLPPLGCRFPIKRSSPVIIEPVIMDDFYIT